MLTTDEHIQEKKAFYDGKKKKLKFWNFPNQSTNQAHYILSNGSQYWAWNCKIVGLENPRTVLNKILSPRLLGSIKNDQIWPELSETYIISLG